MEKKGHLLVAETLKEIYPEHHFWVAFGSIAPDIFVHTYLKGHTYDTAAEMIFQKIEKLEEKGKVGIWSSFQLGYILHYIEDFFTYPHNSCFAENLSEHIRYEKHQTKALLEKEFAKTENVTFVKDIRGWLIQNHKEYMTGDMTGEMNAEHDEAYIFTAAKVVAKHFIYAFRLNELRTFSENSFENAGEYEGQELLLPGIAK